ncbi:MAG: FtsX-like permease family protein [Defluviitaleaceae bacterium]|nr:FtsX-like permease family protein [Defluviitaleaceae bacterium]
MRKNVYLKSMLRQPGRTFLLMLLIATVVFAVVLRMSEYINMDDHIAQIAATYTSIGVLQADTQLADVSQSADMVASSEFVGFEDRRRFAEGLMADGIFSADMSGMPSNFQMDGFIDFHNQPRLTETIFLGFLWQFERLDDYNTWLVFWVNWLPVGMPEHIQAGTTVSVLFNHNFMINGEMVRIDPLEFMELEQSYLIRAYFPQRVGPGMASWFPNQMSVGTSLWGGPTIQDLTMIPLSDNFDNLADAIWFLHANFVEDDDGNTGTHFDFIGILDEEYIDGFWEEIWERVAFLQHNQQSVWLQTTRNMYLMPQMFVDSSLRMINDFNNPGRLISYDDYLNANPVVVVNSDFARIRGFSVGDTLVVTVPKNQYLSGFAVRQTGWGPFTDFVVRSDLTTSSEDDDIENLAATENTANFENSEEINEEINLEEIRLELEIIGIVDNGLPGFRTQAPRYMYIPDSLLPEDFAISGLDGFLPADRFSFVLTSSRHEQVFYAQYRDILAEMGLTLAMLWTGSGGFWVAADSIMLMATFNAIAMWIALILIFVISSAILLQQRRKDFAILRALGVSSAKIFKQLLFCVIVIIVPPILLGSWAAWEFTQTEMFYVNLDEILAQVAPRVIPGAGLEPRFMRMVPQFDVSAGLPLSFVLTLAGIFFAIMLIMLVFGTFYMLRNSTLALLQGASGQPRRAKISTTAEPATFANAKFESSSLQNKLTTAKKWEFSNKMQYVKRQITRAPLQSVLCLVVALAFMMLLGWLQQSIYMTEVEIATLQDTMPVEIEIFSGTEAVALGAGTSFPAPFDRRMDDFIAPRTIERIYEAGYFQNIYYEAAHFIAFLVAPENGNFPQNWQGAVGLDTQWSLWDPIAMELMDSMLGAQSLERLLERHSNTFVNGIIGDLDITFAPGFSYADFAYTPDAPLPIVVSQNTLNQQGLQLGDMAFISYRLLLPRVWQEQSAIIIGVHNDHILGTATQQAMIVPVEFLEYNISSWLGFSRLAFEVMPEYSNAEDLENIRETVNEIIRRGDGTFWILNFFMWDEELRNLSGALEQVLVLLNLLYPIVIAISVTVALFLSILLMLQNAKIVAIMSVLGTGKIKIALILCTKQLVIFLGGIILGLLLTLLVGWNFTLILPLATVYFVGAVVGSIFGTVLVTKKSPIDMLQVRE